MPPRRNTKTVRDARRSLAVLIVAAASLLAGCGGLPPMPARGVTHAPTDTADTPLGRATAARAAGRAPDLAGVHPLAEPRDAFAARAVLARGAHRSLDIQYYIFRDDVSGRLLLDAIIDAARRGVRVRLLLDDQNSGGMENLLSDLDALPGVEVRLFNPYANRRLRWLDWIVDFDRVNRRMHNKAFIADNRAAIIGGRNIGDEYFGAGDGIVFADLDLLAIGPLVEDISKVFDDYWNSASAWPADALLPPPSSTAAGLARELDEAKRSQAARAYLESVRETRLLEDLESGTLELQWVKATLVHDRPEKVLDTTGRAEHLLLPALDGLLGDAGESLDLVSPYFVPGEDGTRALADLVARGVSVDVLTNSLAATDVPVVHAGYAKRREALLRAGVRLWELKPTVPLSVRRRDGAGLGGSSSASLHAKTFAVDGRRLFVGSLNLDPRSIWLNTELGVVLHDTPLAARLASIFGEPVSRLAYEVRLRDDGRLQWLEHSGEDTPIAHDIEPGTGWFRRMMVRVLSWLPIDWLL